MCDHREQIPVRAGYHSFGLPYSQGPSRQGKGMCKGAKRLRKSRRRRSVMCDHREQIPVRAGCHSFGLLSCKGQPKFRQISNKIHKNSPFHGFSLHFAKQIHKNGLFCGFVLLVVSNSIFKAPRLANTLATRSKGLRKLSLRACSTLLCLCSKKARNFRKKSILCSC